MKATTSWDGSSYHYPTGAAEITAVKMTIPEGPAGDFHCHPVPAFGYVLKGILRTETDSGQNIVFKAGDAVAEVMSAWHRSQVVEGPVEIIAFYAGAEGEQNTRMLSSGELCES
jgi:quercetin dioxygenase-like cupin family protein